MMLEYMSQHVGWRNVHITAHCTPSVHTISMKNMDAFSVVLSRHVNSH